MQNPFKAVMNHLLNTYYGTKIDPKPKTINKVALSMNVDNLLTR